MNFWDSSALLPLLLREAHTDAVLDLLRADPDVILWWSTLVECVSALRRRHREGALPIADLHEARRNLAHLHGTAVEIQAEEPVRDRPAGASCAWTSGFAKQLCRRDSSFSPWECDGLAVVVLGRLRRRQWSLELGTRGRRGALPRRTHQCWQHQSR